MLVLPPGSKEEEQAPPQLRRSTFRGELLVEGNRHERVREKRGFRSGGGQNRRGREGRRAEDDAIAMADSVGAS